MLSKNNTLSGIFTIVVVLMLNACVVVVEDSDATVKTRSSAFTEYWYYYPNDQVYYHAHEHYYYYPDGGDWKKAKQLPPDRRIGKKDRVLLKVAGLPYRQHAYHQKKYPARIAAVNQYGKGNHAGWVNHPHPETGNSTGEHSSSHANNHSTPANAVPAKQERAYAKQQDTGQTEPGIRAQSGHAKTGRQIPPGHARRDQQSAPDSIEHEEGTEAAKRKVKPAVRIVHEDANGNIKNGSDLPDSKYTDISRQGKSERQYKTQDVNKGDVPGNKRAGVVRDGPQQASSADPRGIKAAKSNQPRQSDSREKKNRQLGSNAQGDESESETGTENSVDKVVELNMNSGH